VAVLLFYLGLGALLTAEEAGVFFLPGDISLVAAGVQASADGAPLLALVAWIVSSCAMVAGASALFRGVQSSSRSGRVLPARVKDLILRHHVWGVMSARMVPGLRNATVFAAAAAGLGRREFMLGLVPAAFGWSGVLLLLGWFGGDAITAALGRLAGMPIIRWGSLALIAAALLYALYRVRIVRHSPEYIPPPAPPKTPPHLAEVIAFHYHHHDADEDAPRSASGGA
jgi:membrane protein DedA with SNARE-associated domain